MRYKLARTGGIDLAPAVRSRFDLGSASKIGLLGVTIALMVVTACGRRETPAAIAARENRLLLGNGAEPPDLDPQVVTGSPEINIAEALFEGLTRLDPTDLHAIPGVAERWEVSPDGLVYTFHLRADAKWTNGDPVTAQDFAASFQRILTPALASENVDLCYFVAGAEEFYHGEIRDFSGVGYKALDDRTVRITMKNPTPFFPQMVAGRYYFPVPVAVIKHFGGLAQKGTLWTRPANIVTNGPFVLKEWKRNQYVEVARSDTYWDRDHIKLGFVRFMPIESAESEELSFRSGQLHVTQTVPSEKIAVYRRHDPERLRIAPYAGTYYYAFNTRVAPFTDARVRRALSLAVDRQSLVDRITRGGEKTAGHFVPDGIGGFVSRTHVTEDPEEARRLLAEAGYPGGRGFPAVTLLYNTFEAHRAIAEALQQMWRDRLGINISLQNEEWGVYLDHVHGGHFQLARRGLIIEPYDPWLFLKTWKTGNGYNDTFWSNAEYDALVDKCAATSDPVKREEMCQQMEKLLMDEMPIMPLYFYTQKHLIDPVVKDWPDNFYGRPPLTQAWLQN